MTALCVISTRHTDPDDTPEADIGYLCFGCFGRLRSSLLELPAIAGWLHVNLAAGGVGGENVSGTREEPIPLRQDILDLIGPVAPNPTAAIERDGTWTGYDIDQLGETAFFDEMRSWASLVEEESKDAWTDRETLIGAIGYLSEHLSWLAAQPWVDEFAGRIKHLSRVAHRVAPWRAETKRDPEPCVCGVRAVWWHIAEGFTRCERQMGGCGRTQTVTEHQMNASLPETRRAAG